MLGRASSVMLISPAGRALAPLRAQEVELKLLGS